MVIEADFQNPFVDALYGEFLERGISYFLPSSHLEILEPIHPKTVVLRCNQQQDRILELEWLGFRYALTKEGMPFTEDEKRLLESIGSVLSARYRLLFNADLAARSFDLFRGLPEDRHISAFLSPSLYAGANVLTWKVDRVADAIEVLRVSSLTTYENRRISTGALLFGTDPDPCHSLPPLPPGAIRYSSPLTSIRSFLRLCDALQTLTLVNQEGLLTNGASKIIS